MRRSLEFDRDKVFLNFKLKPPSLTRTNFISTKMSSCFRNCLCLCMTNSRGEQEGEIAIGGHPHPFSYHEQKRRGSTYQCNGCQQTGFGPYYSCNGDGCNFHYHKLCGDILRLHSPPISNHHPYPDGRYVFRERAPSKVRYCIACGDQVRGLRYKVRRGLLYWHLNNRAFHPLCTLLPPRIQEPGGGNFVLVLKESIRDKCTICEGEAKGWAYNSTCGTYCYHVGCVKNKIIQSWQNGGNDRQMTIRLEIQLPQIQELAAAAIRLIIGALFDIPNVAAIFTVLFT